MDYEKKYKEALERAKEKYTKCYSPTLLDYIFPELKENKDIEIRRSIIRNLKRYINCIKDGYDAPSAKDFVIKEIEKQIAWLEKQGDKPQGKTAFEAIKKEKVDNQTCVKPADKFKPKFKVGDWVVFDNGNVEHITSVGTHGYTFDDGDYLLHDECDKIAHLWSIQDAKDGDVLVSRSPFIYGKQCPYGGLNWCNNKFIKASNFIFTDSPVHPATEEQRDFLFQKMKEAGCMFDFEKKELKKIKNDIEIPFGAKDSELQEATYYIPKGFHAEIDDDKVVIKKGEKPAAWSEEDERIKKLLIHLIKTVYDNTHYLTYAAYKGLIAWLEKLDDNVEL